MFKILIIDDSENRNEIYKSIFDGSNKIVYKLIKNNIDEIEGIIKSEYFDISLVDHNLDKGDSLSSITELLNKSNLPIILISEKREFDYNDYDSKIYKDCIELKTIIDLFFKSKEGGAYETIYLNNRRFICSRIISSIIKCHGSYALRDEQKKIVVCQISDFHFKPDDFTKENLQAILNALIVFIKRRSRKPDLFVFTGDVGRFGYDSNYDMELYNKITSEFSIMDHISDRVMIVPGNHDIDYSMFLSDVMKDKGKYKIDELSDFTIKTASDLFETIKQLKITPNDFEEFKPGDIYKHEFIKFAYKLTGDPQYLIPNFYIENRCFRKKGFNIFGLSNAERFRNVKTLMEDVSQSYKKYQFDTNIENKSTGMACLPSICIGHASPLSLGFMSICATNEEECSDSNRLGCRSQLNQNSKCPKSNKFTSALNERNSIIYMFGHEHKNISEVSSDGKMLFIGSTAIDGSNPFSIGINLTELTTLEDKIEAGITHCLYTNGEFTAQKLKSYNYSLKEKKWNSVE